MFERLGRFLESLVLLHNRRRTSKIEKQLNKSIIALSEELDKANDEIAKLLKNKDLLEARIEVFQQSITDLTEHSQNQMKRRQLETALLQSVSEQRK